MYFPDISFVSFLWSLDEIVKGIVNTATMKDNDKIIKVTSFGVNLVGTKYVFFIGSS